MKLFRFVPVIALAVAACGGGDDAPPAETPPEAPAPAPAGPAAPTGAMTIPDWYAVNHDARTVAIELTAGATADNNYWNYNGFIKGQIAITVPEGYTVEITLINEDPNMGHSVGISTELANFTLVSPDPVFPVRCRRTPSR